MRRTANLVLTLFLVTVAACNKKADGAGTPSTGPAPAADGRPTVLVKVGADGYHPSETKAPGGKPVRLVFTRTTDEGCGQEVVFPSLDIKKKLPLNEPVNIDVTMPASGKLAFTCGMNMYQGSVVAE